MKIMISPAKQMKTEDPGFEPRGVPIFEQEAGKLIRHLKSMSKDGLGKALKIEGRLLEESFRLYGRIDLDNGTRYAALPLFKGIQYSYMAGDVFTDGEYDYLEEHLRILSALYGVLRPFDGIMPYRLEMTSAIAPDGCGNLYGFWSDKVSRSLGEELIVDLASREYSALVRPYSGNRRIVGVRFYEQGRNSLVEKGVHVKMLRGMLVRFMATNRITTAEGIKDFSPPGFFFNKGLSGSNEIVFTGRWGFTSPASG